MLKIFDSIFFSLRIAIRFLICYHGSSSPGPAAGAPGH